MNMFYKDINMTKPLDKPFEFQLFADRHGMIMLMVNDKKNFLKNGELHSKQIPLEIMVKESRKTIFIWRNKTCKPIIDRI